jgi:LacI family transcriptional regulator
LSRKTIYDIARKAEVSIATVSRVMNDSPAISDKTREKVLNIADEIGYYPQAYAQGLARKKKNRIMILVPVISNYFFMEVLAGIQDEISGSNLELNIFNVSDIGESFYAQIETIIKKQSADGYILISTHLKDSEFKNLLKYGTPITLVDEMHSGLDSIAVDNNKGSQKAVEYFIDQGYTKIAFIIASRSAKPIVKRIDGYKKALTKASITINESLIVTGKSMYRDGFSEQNGYEAMKKLLQRSDLPDACFCASDIQAIGAMKAMLEQDIKIPVIGYDDITISSFIGLSTIRQPMYKMGTLAIKKMVQRMKNSSLQAVQTTLTAELILRSSTEI